MVECLLLMSGSVWSPGSVSNDCMYWETFSTECTRLQLSRVSRNISKIHFSMNVIWTSSYRGSLFTSPKWTRSCRPPSWTQCMVLAVTCEGRPSADLIIMLRTKRIVPRYLSLGKDVRNRSVLCSFPNCWPPVVQHWMSFKSPYEPCNVILKLHNPLHLVKIEFL